MGNQQEVRVRFAPSPTGFLHLGGARTALFNWLFARHNQGKFILRIEDTDAVRSKDIFLEQILKDMQWLGLDWDEGPYFQSKRIEFYRRGAEGLLGKGLAYKDGSAIILKVPDKPFEFTDLIRGQIRFEAGSFKDQVLIKSDGTPTYNFACCCDDNDMRVSHIIRGDDHISNTPKQVAIYEALGWTLPQFAHIPLIVSADRARLSKRKGAMPISYYRDQGYLPAALFNFLALLGWSLGGRKEIAAREEIVREFNLEKVLKTAAAFDEEKLEWMNGEYIQKMNTSEFAEQVVPILLEQKLIKKDYDQKKLGEIIELFKPRIKTLADFPQQADYFFKEKVEFADETEKILLQNEKTKTILTKLIKALEIAESFDAQTVEAVCRKVIAEEGIKGGELIHPVRAALTGKKVGPGLFELMSVLGKEKSLARLAEVVQWKS